MNYNSVLEDFKLSGLELVEEYVYYNQPILFACKNYHGQVFLGFWLEETEVGDSWLYVPMSEERLGALKNGKIDWRDAFLHSETGFVFQVKTFGDRTPDLIESIPNEAVDEQWLPSPGEFLSCEV